jgi:hypothetical protein
LNNSINGKKKEREIKSRTRVSSWIVSSGAVADGVVPPPHARLPHHPNPRPHCSGRRPCHELGGHAQIGSRWWEKACCGSFRVDLELLDVAAVLAGSAVAGTSVAVAAGAVAVGYDAVESASAGTAAVGLVVVVVVVAAAAASALLEPEAAGRIDW